MSGTTPSKMSTNRTVNRLFIEIGSRLENVKKKQTLHYELIKLLNEIQYIKDKITFVQNQLGQTISDIDLMKQKLVEPEKELQTRIIEKNRIEKKQADIENIEKQIAKKVLLLPDIKKRMRIIRNDYEDYQISFFTIKEKYDALLAENDLIEKMIAANKTKINDFSNEINVMKNTRDLLKGLLPQDFDQKTFQEIQINHEETLKTYIHDMNQNMDSIKKESDRLSHETKEMKQQITPLQNTIQMNQTKINQIYQEIGTTSDIQSLIQESNTLTQENQIIPKKIEDMAKESQLFKNHINALDENIDHQQKKENELNQRLAYLTKRKQQMDAVSDITHFITQLQKETYHSQKQIVIHKQLGQLSQSSLKEVLSIKTQLQSQLESIMEPFIDFEQSLTSLLE